MKTTLNLFVALLVMTSFVKWGNCENNPDQSVAPPGLVFKLLALNKDIETGAWHKYHSPSAFAVSPDSNYLYVAEQTAKKVSRIDLKTQKLDKTVLVPNEPTGIVVSPTTGKLYVTCASDWWPDGMVCEIDMKNESKVSRRLPGGHGARSPAISHDGKTLYICNQHGDDIYIVDVASGICTDKMGAMREPYSSALTPDDAVLVVANALPVQKSTDTLKIACKVLLFDTKAKKLRDTIPMPTGSHSVYGMTMAPDGKYAYITHLIAMFAIPATRVDNGWIHTNNLAIVDIANRKILNDVSLDDPFQGAGNPWGISSTPDGKILAIAHSGSNEMSVLNVPKLIHLADSADYSQDAISVEALSVTLSHDLAALIKQDIISKIIIKGKAPRAMMVVGNKAYTAGYFDNFIEIFDLQMPGGDTKTKAAGTIELGPKVPETSDRKGECAYFDASLCFQKWQSCHSCHPHTRTDGLNWTLRGDLVAPKNAKSMLLSWWTPPTAWSGGRADARESIRAGMINELFLQPDEAVATCIDTFFMKLKPVPSPYLVKGKLSEAAKRGREIFLHHPTLDCKTCHIPPLYYDPNKFRNGGIQDPYDANTMWDTPTIIESWRSAPFNHLGSMDQMEDLLKWKGHSNAGELPKKDFDDMMEYILSL